MRLADRWCGRKSLLSQVNQPVSQSLQISRPPQTDITVAPKASSGEICDGVCTCIPYRMQQRTKIWKPTLGKNVAAPLERARQSDGAGASSLVADLYMASYKLT
jgi:hypothetical protein